MKTMIVVAHLDDETICCGGLLKQISDKVKKPIKYLTDVNLNNNTKNQVDDLNKFSIFDYLNDQNNYKLPDDITLAQPFSSPFKTTTIYYSAEIVDARVVALCKGRDKDNSKKRSEVFREIIYSDLKFGYCINDYYDLELERYKISDIADFIQDEIKEYKPDRIIVPSEYDLHQDHVIVSKASKIAARNLVPELLEMFNPCTKILKENYFDTSLNIRYEHKYKIECCKKYTTEKIDTSKIQKKEYFKTIWREL